MTAALRLRQRSVQAARLVGIAAPSARVACRLADNTA